MKYPIVAIIKQLSSDDKYSWEPRAHIIQKEEDFVLFGNMYEI